MSSTRKQSAAVVKEYRAFASNLKENFKDEETVRKYQIHLENIPSSTSKIMKNVSHVKTWLKRAFSVDVNVKQTSPTNIRINPHTAYT